MKSEIETLVEKIYHAQTYGKDCDKLIEKLNKLTAVNKPTKAAKNNFVKPVVSGRSEQSNCIHCHEHILTVKTLKYKCKHCGDEKWEQLD